MYTPIKKLQEYFANGKRPNGQQFAELIKSLYHKSEKIDFENIKGLSDAVNSIKFEGAKTYQTLAELEAVTPVPVSGTAAKVANDSDSSNNGYYAVVNGTWVQDADMLAQVVEGDNFNKAVSGKAVADCVDGLFSANIFEPANILQGTFIDPSNGNTNSHDSYWSSPLISLRSGETHITFNRLDGWFRMAFYAADGKHIEGWIYPALSTLNTVDKSGTIAIPSGAVAVRFSYPNSVSPSEVQLEYGTERTEFKEYGTKLLKGLDDKVSKEVGKGLSTYDFDDGALAKLNEIEGKVSESDIYSPSPNIFDTTSVIQERFVDPTNGNINSHASYWASLPIVLRTGETHITFNLLKRWFRMAFYDADGNAVEGWVYPALSTINTVSESGTIAIPSSAVSVRFSYPNVVSPSEVQLEYGTERTALQEFGTKAISADFVEKIEKGLPKPPHTERLKIVVKEDSFYVRTSFSESEDIITTYRYAVENGNITPDATYKGLKTQSDDEILATDYWHLLFDSTAPIWSDEFWYLYAQHGYVIPTVQCVHDKTDTDVGSVWTDNLGRKYTLGKVAGTTLFFLPEIIEENGKYVRSWKRPTDNNAITSITHVSGAVNTSAVTEIAAKNAYQIKPIQKSVNRKFLSDGKEVGVGTHYCDEFFASETLSCLNPYKVTQWFPEIIHEAYNYEMCQITQSFIISGLSTKVNTLINVKHPVDFNYYAANQLRTLVPVNGEESYAIIPKVIKSNANKQFNASDYHNNPTLVIERNSIDLVNENELPDRLITWLETHGQGVLGFATGLDLRRGATTNENRLNTVPIGSQALYFSPSNRNKFYVRVLNGEAFGHTLSTSLVGEINYYYSYFNPADNEAKVYHVKDGNTHLIYVHYDKSAEKLEILLPNECEGLAFSIVEKTVGAALLTEIAQNNKLYALFTNAANYLVLKSK